METNRLVRTILVCTILPFASDTLGDDLFKPDWRGKPGSTYQKWLFDTDSNPAAPNVVENEYGSPSATILLGPVGGEWLYQMDGFGTPTGYWDLRPGCSMVMDINNRPITLAYKEIWVQVLYYEGLIPAPFVTVPGAELVGSQKILIETIEGPFTEAWYLTLTKWRIEPNPKREQIIISVDPDWGALVDQVVVDTICGPEPQFTADFNHDSKVNLVDFAMLIQHWKQNAPSVNLAPPGVIDLADISVFASHWLEGL